MRRVLCPTALILAAGTALPGLAGAQGLYGYAQVQFRQVERRVPEMIITTRYDTTVTGPDTVVTARPDTVVRYVWDRRQSWIQTYDMNAQRTLRSSVLLQLNGRLTDLQYVDEPDRSRSPQGSVRLTHARWGAYASHQPSEVTTGIGPARLGAPPDSTRAATVTARTQVSQVTGQLALPRLPRVDLSWVRRHQDATSFGNSSSGENRDARLSYTNGDFSGYAAVGDQRRFEGGGRATGRQQYVSAGTAVRIAPLPRGAADLRYDFSNTRSGTGPAALGSNQSHALGVSGSYRASERDQLTLQYGLRGTRTPGPTGSLVDQEGALLWSQARGRGLRLSGGGGFRTVRDATGRGTLGYATAVIAGNGRVWRGWTGAASASHTTNWDPLAGTYSIETVRGGSTLRLARALDLASDAGAIWNSSSVDRDQRLATDAGARIQATPLRSLTLAGFVRAQGVGAGLGSLGRRTQAVGLDGTWRPVQTLECSGNWSESRASARTGIQSARSATVRWLPSARLQVTGTWTRTSQSVATTTPDQLVGTEVRGLRLVSALGRRLALSAGYTEADPGAERRENRQADATLTWNLGR